jgi:hypothetical protein
MQHRGAFFICTGVWVILKFHQDKNRLLLGENHVWHLGWKPGILPDCRTIHVNFFYNVV